MGGAAPAGRLTPPFLKGIWGGGGVHLCPQQTGRDLGKVRERIPDPSKGLRAGESGFCIVNRWAAVAVSCCG